MTKTTAPKAPAKSAAPAVTTKTFAPVKDANGDVADQDRVDWNDASFRFGDA